MVYILHIYSRILLCDDLIIIGIHIYTTQDAKYTMYIRLGMVNNNLDHTCRLADILTGVLVVNH